MNVLPTFSREKTKVKMADIAYYAFSIIFFLLAVLMYTYPSIQTVQQFYKEQSYLTEEAALREMQNVLVLEYERLMSPYEMKERAGNMGFIKPEAEQVIYVKKMR